MRFAWVVQWFIDEKPGVVLRVLLFQLMVFTNAARESNDTHITGKA